ncbi:hypothetical protein PHYBOEH_009359 [Phytophthora boehmeriae]|uniref:Glycoside hydrolase n=1 Tax=Phytophthora boehmeriae TaxID=109152 RepID=A0A8T1VXG4_9STRA|nr:hypothetical protein PHYBOEH_009359 [Phytophthora boehmeriae]
MVFGIPCSRLTVGAAVALTLTLSSPVHAEELCSIVPNSYSGAKTDHSELATAIEALEKHAIASWYTDRLSSDERSTMISNMLSECSEDTRLSIVVYGIPNKDCDAGYSSGGSVKSTSDYQAFLKELTEAVGSRKVLYVVEPDAVGLLAKDGSCGSSAGYLDNLKVAVEALSANVNAELYIDVGYWMLADSTSASKVAPIMKELGSCGKVKGVTINTSNYRSNEECANYCTTFQTAMGSSDMSCIVDTSRNYNGLPTSDWCNVATAGIGKPPTSETGISNLDYFMWIKPPGESDGECSSGPAAGTFFAEGFKALWDQGYFVSEGGMASIDGTADQNQDQYPSETPAPTTSAPASTDAAQTTVSATLAPAENPTPTPTEDSPLATTKAATEAPSTPASTPIVTASTSNCKAKLRRRKL